jgi:uncharacterized membrane protein
MWNPEQIELAQVVRNITPTQSVFLTADTHNHWVVDLSGRKIVMGFRGWLWSWGIEYQTREKDVHAIFRGDPAANALIRQYGIDYVIIGPTEKDVFQADPAFFETHHMRMLDMAGYLIYKTR